MVKKGFAGRFFGAFNAGFNTVTNKYIKSLDFLIKHKWISITGLVAIAAISFWLVKTTPTGLFLQKIRASYCMP